MTTSITNDVFHARVTAFLSNHLYSTALSDHATVPIPTVPPLAPTDTYLAPGEGTSQILGVISPWIDLCSPDPAVYNVSRQVLELEVAFAAFCGLSALILPSPRLHHGAKHSNGIGQYAYAIQQALNIGSFIHFSVALQMMDNPAELFEADSSLAHLARPQIADNMENESKSLVNPARKHDFFGTWDAWNVIRTVSNYHTRLFVGKNPPPSLFLCSPNEWFVPPN